MTKKKSKPPVAGQITTVGDRSIGIVGGTLADMLDLDNWKEIDNGRVVREQKGPDTIIVGPKREPKR